MDNPHLFQFITCTPKDKGNIVHIKTYIYKATDVESKKLINMLLYDENNGMWELRWNTIFAGLEQEFPEIFPGISMNTLTNVLYQSNLRYSDIEPPMIEGSTDITIPGPISMHFYHL